MQNFSGSASANLNVKVDVNDLIKMMNGQDAEKGERKFHNDWKSRDQFARQQGTYNNGRRSEDCKGPLGISNGKNYYAWSALGAMMNGIKLDSKEVYQITSNLRIFAGVI